MPSWRRTRAAPDDDQPAAAGRADDVGPQGLELARAKVGEGAAGVGVGVPVKGVVVYPRSEN